MYQYIHNHERHEKIALAVPEAGDRATSPAMMSPNEDPDALIHRYIADVQQYEWLAVGLDQPDQPASPAEKNPQPEVPFIPVFDGPGLAALEEGEEDVEVNEEMMRLRLYVNAAPSPLPLRSAMS
jgi:hypothetical protein